MNFDIRKKIDFSDMWKDTNFGDINFDILTLVIYCIYMNFDIWKNIDFSDVIHTEKTLAEAEKTFILWHKCYIIIPGVSSPPPLPQLPDNRCGQK